MKTKTIDPDVMEFAERVHEFLAQMRETQTPMVLSVQGTPALVVIDLRLAEYFAKCGQRELVELLSHRIKDVDSGADEGIPADEFFA